MTPPAPTSSAASPPRLQPAALQRSFPLVALLQLATFCAALGACVDGAKLGAAIDDMPRWADYEWGAVLGAAFFGGLLGFFIGLGQLRMWRSALVGGLVGALAGLAILAVYAAPAPLIRAAAAAAVLVLSTLIVRLHAA